MNYLSQSGPLIWVVVAFGAVGLLFAIRYAIDQRRQLASTAVGATVAAAIVASIATVAGFQRSVAGLREVAADDRWIYLFGLKESLNNLVIALVFGCLVTLLLTAGSYRQQPRQVG